VNDEFYVGYAAAMPPRLARGTRRAVAAAIAVALGLAFALAAATPRSAVATFEFGRERTIDGVLMEWPYPAVLLGLDDRHTRTASPADVVWLTGAGKRGALPLVLGLDGRRVRVRGSWIERDGHAMLQVEAGGVAAITGTLDLGPLRTLDEVRLAGEIVDGKCHLGVMKPGEGPVHRDCAVRCLLGGVVPFLHSRDGALPRVPLVGRGGRPFDGDLSALVGRPVVTRGTLVERAGVAFLVTDARRIDTHVR
jgi:hypothetical protein